MIVKSAFIIMAPDGDPARHRATLKTAKTEVTMVIIKEMDFDKGVEVCRDLVQKEGVRVIFLCPGFTHQAVARIAEAVGEKVAVHVARADPPGMALTGELLNEAGFFD
jgi:hypothetical protein